VKKKSTNYYSSVLGDLAERRDDRFDKEDLPDLGDFRAFFQKNYQMFNN
jgi:hypothetical protein